MSKYTPGGWVYEVVSRVTHDPQSGKSRDDGWVSVRDADGVLVTGLHPNDSHIAHRIVMFSEMLEELKFLARVCNGAASGVEIGERGKRVHALIAKATGGDE